MNFSSLTKLATNLLISELKTDLGKINFNQDKTTKLLIKKKKIVNVRIFTKEKIVLCGGKFVKDFIGKNFPKIKIKLNYKDGDEIKKNTNLILLEGDVRFILIIERTVLNFLQHLSSIASETKKYVVKLKNSNTKLLDTRKTTCGLRYLEKYATKMGGAINHRFGLFDEILIKDNHIKALGGIRNTLKILLEKKINYKIECDTLSQVRDCIAAGSTYILLDNMSPTQVKKIINCFGKKAKFEVSGGVNLKNITKYSKVGANYISTSKITLCSKSVDISLDLI
jgi:nicotinate-nucleotide pyrophosphorylase (carboxylating)